MHYQQITSILNGDKTICTPLRELFFILFELQYLLRLLQLRITKSGAPLAFESAHNYQFFFGDATCRNVTLSKSGSSFWDETIVAQTTEGLAFYWPLCSCSEVTDRHKKAPSLIYLLVCKNASLSPTLHARH